MNHASRDNGFTGTYLDDQESKWNWTCPQPTAENVAAEGSASLTISVASALAMAYLA